MERVKGYAGCCCVLWLVSGCLLDGVHERALDAVEDDDADGEECDHEEEAVGECAPREFAGAEDAVFECFEDACEWVEFHDGLEFGVVNHGEWVDDGCGVHPEFDEEAEEVGEVVVFGGEGGEDDAEAEGESGEHEDEDGEE